MCIIFPDLLESIATIIQSQKNYGLAIYTGIINKVTMTQLNYLLEPPELARSF